MNKDAVAEISQQYQAETAQKVVPEGYKQTEVGVIPEDWEVVVLDELNPQNFPAVKAGPFGSSLTKNIYVSFGYKIYGQEQVIRGDHSYGDYFIDEDKYRQLRSCEVAEGDILLSLVGTVGKLLVIPGNAAKGIINPRLLRFRFDKSRVLSLFFKYLFESELVQNSLSMTAQGGTMAVLNARMLKELIIPLPDINEQITIANALSDTDALLSELEKLIAKKQAIKTATMQQLLTGRTRLPQFAHHPDGSKKGYKQSELGEIPEDWEVTSIGETLSIRHGKNQKEVENSSGRYPIYGTGGQMGWAMNYLYDKPSVLIGRKGTINKPRYIDKPFWTVDTLFYSEINKGFCAKFVFYKFCQIDWEQYNEASGVPSLNAKTIEKVCVSFPEIKEQITIATILSDIDKEIQALEHRLNKTRQIKQGMMQELLTGKTRLIKGGKNV